jgi:hypothetical protein
MKVAWRPDLAFVGFHVAAAALYSRMETVPSDEPTARMRPSSCGAHAMELIDAVCSVAGVTYTYTHAGVRAPRSWPGVWCSAWDA